MRWHQVTRPGPIHKTAGYRLGFKVTQSWKKGMVLRNREQERDKVKVHLHKPVPKARGAAKAK